MIHKPTIIVIFLFHLRHVIHCQIPRICAKNVTSNDKVCCPTNPNNGLVCGGVQRGFCSPISVLSENGVSHLYFPDDRHQWPRHFFHFLCQCHHRYFGLTCESCQFGWTGTNCTQKKIYKRKNILFYNHHEKLLFRSILNLTNEISSDFFLLREHDLIHSDPLFQPQFLTVSIRQYFVGIHAYASRATLMKNSQLCLNTSNRMNDLNHASTAFLLWHRYFMLLYEQTLQRIAKEIFHIDNFTLPYWDWVDASHCEICQDDLIGASGKISHQLKIQRLSKQSVFYNWSEYCQPPGRGGAQGKCFGCHFNEIYEPLNRHWIAFDFPTQQEVKEVLKKKKFYVDDEDKLCESFHNSLEGTCGSSPGNVWMHNKVHNLVLGSFCCSPTSANDPLFYLHHSQIDRILQAWIVLHRPNAETDLPLLAKKPGQSRDSYIVALMPLMRNRDMLIDSVQLGYTYDSFTFGK